MIAEAANGREAVEKAIKLKPDVAVLDISMPELDGLEVTRQIRESVPRCQSSRAYHARIRSDGPSRLGRRRERISLEIRFYRLSPQGRQSRFRKQTFPDPQEVDIVLDRIYQR